MMTMSDLATPCLVIHGHVVKRNLERLASYTNLHGIGLRPHTKTHKSHKLASMQIDLGAVGLAVAKVGEAKVMAEDCNDLLVAYPVVAPQRCKALATLAREKTVRVAADSSTGIRALSGASTKMGTTLGVLVEFDVGLKRTGVQTPDQTLQMAREVDKAPGLRLDGLMIYPGNIRAASDEQTESLQAINALLEETLDLWRCDGLEAAIISGGSTPTAYQSHLVRAVTEIRPGTYAYNDMNTVYRGYVSLEDCAARVIVTVVSDAVPGQVVIDAGSKMLSSDRCAGQLDLGFGHIIEYPHARIAWMNEEHGVVNISDCDTAPSVGDRLTVIPNHICPCVNLQDTFWWVEGEAPPQLLKVDARGKVT